MPISYPLAVTLPTGPRPALISLLSAAGPFSPGPVGEPEYLATIAPGAFKAWPNGAVIVAEGYDFYPDPENGVYPEDNPYSDTFSVYARPGPVRVGGALAPVDFSAPADFIYVVSVGE